MDERFGLRTVVEGIAFDQAKGIGNVPNNQDIGYLGAAVMMRPSVFLSLAAPLSAPGPTLGFVLETITAGHPIASAILNVDLDPNGGGLPEVRGHEGRHRMLAVLEAVGDVEVPVHVLPRNMYARHLDDGLVERLRAGMRREIDGVPVEGPLYGGGRPSARNEGGRHDLPARSRPGGARLSGHARGAGPLARDRRGSAPRGGRPAALARAVHGGHGEGPPGAEDRRRRRHGGTHDARRRDRHPRVRRPLRRGVGRDRRAGSRAGGRRRVRLLVGAAAQARRRRGGDRRLVGPLPGAARPFRPGVRLATVTEGSCGSRAFYDLLDEAFTKDEVVPIPQWRCTNDVLRIHTKL